MAVLMNKNYELVEVKLDGSTIQTIGKTFNESKLPIVLQDRLTVANINQWFKGRLIPEKRDSLKETRRAFPGFEKNKNFFSLSDQYWIKHNTRESWEKLNFFTNPFQEDLGRAFFTPWAARQEQVMLPSPDRTTNGNLIKRWMRDEDGTVWLVKAGSEHFKQEPLSEVMASIMIRKLDLLPAVEYHLVIDSMALCAKCKNFVDENTEFVSAWQIFSRTPRPESVTPFTHFMRQCDAFKIIGLEDYLYKMIAIDHIICNYDRHFTNFGFLRNVESGELSFAPLFDNGSAYWGYSNAVQDQRLKLFAELETKALRKLAKQGLLNNAKTSEQMEMLLSAYPEVSEKKSTKIREMMEKRNAEIDLILSDTAVHQHDPSHKQDNRMNEGFYIGL